MAQISEDNALSRVRRVFLSMASPLGFGSDPRLFSSSATVNLPPSMGRCTAVFEQSLRIVEDGAFFDLPDEVRASRYGLLRDMFACAGKCAGALAAMKSKNGKRVAFDDLVSCYSFLEQLCDSLYIFLQSQVSLMKASEEIYASFSRFADSASTDPEIEIFHELKDFLFERKTGILRLHNEFKKLLSTQELERYTKAYTEYTRYYSQIADTALSAKENAI